MPSFYDRTMTNKKTEKDTTAITLFGVFFWIFIASLVVLAVVAIANWG